MMVRQRVIRSLGKKLLPAVIAIVVEVAVRPLGCVR